MAAGPPILPILVPFSKPVKPAGAQINETYFRPFKRNRQELVTGHSLTEQPETQAVVIAAAGSREIGPTAPLLGCSVRLVSCCGTYVRESAVDVLSWLPRHHGGTDARK